MMSGWGFGWIIGGVFMVVCMVMMVRMMGGMMGHGHSGHDGNGWREDPEHTLADRLAKGEIDLEEYKRLREALHGSDHPART